jgi:chromosome segregation ATPase
VPPFGFFKKKEDDAEPSREPHMAIVPPGTISIQQAQDLLRSIESEKVQRLASKLLPITESASKSLITIAELAEDLDHEKIKLEDLEQRHKSVIENSRKTIVASLRREASTEFQLPKTMNDVKKFKEKFETMMNRIGEVTGSHSKMLNIFMKKYAGKLRSEFEDLSKLLSDVKTAVSSLEKDRAPIVRCGNILNTATQKAISIKSIESSVQSIESETNTIESEVASLRAKLELLKGTSEFDQAMSIVQKAENAEKQEEQLRAQLTDLFSHVSRAFTKYSYNISKETQSRLYVLSQEPWKMLYEDDISPYSTLLAEIYKSISSDQIQLKDSDKVLNYIDTILNLLPELQSKVRSLKKEVSTLLQEDSKLIYYKAKELDEKIRMHEEELSRKRQMLDQQKRQIAEKTQEIEALLKEASDILVGLTGQRYSLKS